MTIRIILWIFFMSATWSCGKKIENAEEIISKSISYYGGELFKRAEIQFDFRDRQYIIYRHNGKFKYQRIFKDSLDQIHDVYTNDSFYRVVNGDTLALSEEDKVKYKNSLNSVVYFALLPYKLDDAAVNAELLGIAEIDGADFYEVKITFDQQGGGKDYDDVFTYWFRKNDFQIGYFAYLFHVDGGGTRFRKAANLREYKGIKIADYINYKGPHSYPVEDLDSLYQEGRLEKISEIRLENVSVQIIESNSM